MVFGVHRQPLLTIFLETVHVCTGPNLNISCGTTFSLCENQQLHPIACGVWTSFLLLRTKGTGTVCFHSRWLPCHCVAAGSIGTSGPLSALLVRQFTVKDAECKFPICSRLPLSCTCVVLKVSGERPSVIGSSLYW